MLLLSCLVIYLVSFMQIQAAVVTQMQELSGQCGTQWSLLLSIPCSVPFTPSLSFSLPLSIISSSQLYVISRVYNRGGEYPTTQCSVLQPFTGFMTFVMIFTNVWFHGLLSVTFRGSDVLLRKPVGQRANALHGNMDAWMPWQYSEKISTPARLLGSVTQHFQRSAFYARVAVSKP